jgi:Skp family chaperone for outer membrane proteins
MFAFKFNLCRYAEVDAALEGSEDAEDAFAARAREVRKLVADLKAAYEKYCGAPLGYAIER